jgi:hypothetical protein
MDRATDICYKFGVMDVPNSHLVEGFSQVSTFMLSIVESLESVFFQLGLAEGILLELLLIIQDLLLIEHLLVLQLPILMLLILVLELFPEDMQLFLHFIIVLLLLFEHLDPLLS